MTPARTRGVDSPKKAGIEDKMAEYDAREEAKLAAQRRVQEREQERQQAQSEPAVPRQAAPVLVAAPVISPAAVTVAPAPATTAEQMNSQLLQILIQQQARLALKDQEEEDRKRARDKQREKNAQDHTAKDLLRQARCSHLKGGRRGPRSQVRDYAIYLFTFIDNKTSIKCFLCKMEWKVKDTVEFLFRKGKKIANHTKIGWYEASKMLEQTTNTPASSEVPGQAVTPLATPELDD